MRTDQDDSDPLDPWCRFEPRAAKQPGGAAVPSWLSIETVDRLISTLDVQLIALSECLVRPGYLLDLGQRNTPSFHYLRAGHGILHMPDEKPVGIGPQTLIMVPPRCFFSLELMSPAGVETALVEDPQPASRTGTAASMLCGIFRSLCGDSTELFDTLNAPIFEQFSQDDALEQKLRMVLNELAAGEVCSDVLVSTLMKQLIVALIRRSIQSQHAWTRRFAVLAAAERDEALDHGIQDRNHIK